MAKLPLLLSNLTSDAVIDYRSAQTGQYRIASIATAVAIPVAAGVATFVWWRDSLQASSLFPAAAIFAGALTGTASMLFTRVKDLAAKPRPEIGRDPVYQAAVVFRSALYCAQIALALNAVLVIAVVIPKGTTTAVLVSVGIALFVHMGMKVVVLLQGLRAQMMDTAGSRAQGPIPTSSQTRRAS
ncbi:hypothetical protein [Mycobacterium intracellulare]|uniref:hypothetical protein n=1 Tax=Mycobacterium intracellulare TaxID=1767 RepID=UPI0011560207|nr:hypothetical protein [Mycobacterium intracellulare]